jgi:hypothetical protein
MAVWLGLLVLFAITCGSAFLPLGALNVALNLLIAGIMIVLLAAFLTWICGVRLRCCCGCSLVPGCSGPFSCSR